MAKLTAENIYESLQNLDSVEQNRVLKEIQDILKPTYAEVVAGAKVSRPSTPEPKSNLSYLKRELNSPESPYKGGSKKVQSKNLVHLTNVIRIHDLKRTTKVFLWLI
jgi:hypothetical protein